MYKIVFVNFDKYEIYKPKIVLIFLELREGW